MIAVDIKMIVYCRLDENVCNTGIILQLHSDYYIDFVESD